MTRTPLCSFLLKFSGCLAVLAIVAQADSAIVINEMLINNTGTGIVADQDREFIELRSTTGGVEAMTGLTFLYIEGDGGGSGVIDFALDLSPFSTGTNGLAVFSDGLTSWDPAADPATPINVTEFGPQGDGSGDDLENGSSTYLLVSGFSGASGDDLDTDNDGVLDSTPWTGVVSGVGWKEFSAGTENAYAAQLGFTEFDGAAGSFDPDGYVMAPDGEFVFDLFDDDFDLLNDGAWRIGDSGALDATNTQPVANPLFTLTPGSANTLNVAVPEPRAAVMLLLAAVAYGAVRMRSKLG